MAIWLNMQEFGRQKIMVDYRKGPLSPVRVSVRCDVHSTVITVETLLT
jgi:hypothetical protein